MILVHKSARPPRTLSAAVTLTAALCRDFDGDPDAFRSGKREMGFAQKTYGATAVKQALSRDQHGKCCYCESKFAHAYSGDVEHYRPKGAVVTAGKRRRPGYYWLVYDWDNLFFACAACNQYSKRDQFPLADEARRAGDHRCDLDAESPLLLKPSGPVDPRNHIRFRRDAVVGISRAGTETIRIVGLSREALVVKRVGHIKIVEVLCDAIRLLASDDDPRTQTAVRQMRLQLDELASPLAEFSAAVRDFIDAQPPSVRTGAP